MATVETKYFGIQEIGSLDCVEFPAGLPAFEDEHEFGLIELRGQSPLVFVQSLRTRSLCFLALPADCLVADYELFLAPDDMALLGLDGPAASVSAANPRTLALLTVTESGQVTANLLAPIVVNPATRRAVQAIRMDRAYSHQHVVGVLNERPLRASAGREEACS